MRSEFQFTNPILSKIEFLYNKEFKAQGDEVPTLLLSYLRPIVVQVTQASPWGAYNIPFMNFSEPQCIIFISFKDRAIVIPNYSAQ